MFSSFTWLVIGHLQFITETENKGLSRNNISYFLVILVIFGNLSAVPLRFLISLYVAQSAVPILILVLSVGLCVLLSDVLAHCIFLMCYYHIIAKQQR